MLLPKRYLIAIIYALLTALVLSSCQSPAAKTQTQTPSFYVNEITIDQIHQGIASGKFTCHDLVTRYLQRIKKYNQYSGINALTTINGKAMDRAKQLDRQWLKQKSMNPLHCVPVILKDNFDTHDMPTTAGSEVLKKSFPPDDAFMVKKLRQADAIILAKSNMAEWAFSPYFTVSSTQGTTRNPYDLTRVPAGSSGGTAAAIAANLGAVGMGTDTGNSIRGPASHTSLVGMRSTIGATSRDGVVPLLLNRDIAGPITRTVEDNAKVFSVIAGYDPADPITKLGRNKVAKDYTVFLKKDGLRNARIGVLRALSDTQLADEDIQQLFDNAVKTFKRAGAVMVDPFVINDFTKHRVTNGFCSAFRWDVNKYFKSLGKDAPVKDFMEIVKTKQYHATSQWAIDWVLSAKLPPEKQTPPCVDVQGDPRRKAYLEAVVTAMNKYKVDAIIYPTWNNAPRKIGDLESPHGNNSPVIAPHTGQPAITVPMGFTKENLPAGLQILGRPFDEGKLYRFAYAYEHASHLRKPPKGFE